MELREIKVRSMPTVFTPRPWIPYVALLFFCIRPVAANDSVENLGDEPQAESLETGSMATNPLERAIELNGEGLYAEAAVSFDQIYADEGDLAVLLRAGLAWYQGSFFAASEARFNFWLKTVQALGDKAPDALLAQKTMVEALLKKVSAKVFSVVIEVPDDVERPRSGTTSISISRVAEGYGPEPITFVLTSQKSEKESRTVRLDAGRWVFEFNSQVYENKPETIEVYDDSPLTLSPIPSSRMLPKSVSPDERLAFRESLDLYRAGDYSLAVTAMLEMSKNKLTANESLWLFARTNEKAGNWKAALDAYRTLITNHPGVVDAKEIQSRFKELEQKAAASQAKVWIKTKPEGARFTVYKMDQAVPYESGDLLYPGVYDVKLSWETGFETTKKITVLSKKDQTFTLESALAEESISALRWSVDGVLSAGLGFMTGNQSSLVEITPGPSITAGGRVAWSLNEQIRLRTGFAYSQSQPNFELKAAGSRESVAGHWVFHYFRVPVGADWSSKWGTVFGLDLGVDVLLYAGEQSDTSTNLTPLSELMVPTVQANAVHPVPFLGKGFFVELLYFQQLIALTKSPSSLRLQQISLGVGKTLF